jgi:His-Xaa-Ser system protein HxsD
MTIIKVDYRTVSVLVDEKLFPEEVIFKCFYWYGNTHAVTIEKEKSSFNIKLASLMGDISDALFNQLCNRIKTDLIDFRTRQIIHNETNNIKQILIAKAFSSLDVYDESPRGNINDPIGFTIE